MELKEITSNTVNTISTSLIQSIKDLSKSTDLDTFHKYYLVYNQAWVDWDTMLRLLEIGREVEYKAYAYSLINNVRITNITSGISFDSEVKTLDEFYSIQLKHTDYFPFSPNEIVAWDTEHFIINDFISPSVVVLNRIDKIKK